MKIAEIKQLLEPGEIRPLNYAGDQLKKTQIKVYNFVYACCLSIIIMAGLAFSIIFILPLLSHNRQLPFLFYHFIDYKTSPYFQFMNLITFFNSFIIFCFLNGLYCMLYGKLAMVYCEMLMLKKLFRDVNMEQITSKKKEEEYFNQIKNYIIHHVNILKYAIYYYIIVVILK